MLAVPQGLQCTPLAAARGVGSPWRFQKGMTCDAASQQPPPTPARHLPKTEVLTPPQIMLPVRAGQPPSVPWRLWREQSVLQPAFHRQLRFALLQSGPRHEREPTSQLHRLVLLDDYELLLQRHARQRAKHEWLPRELLHHCFPAFHLRCFVARHLRTRLAMTLLTPLQRGFFSNQQKVGVLS